MSLLDCGVRISKSNIKSVALATAQNGLHGSGLTGLGLIPWGPLHGSLSPALLPRKDNSGFMPSSSLLFPDHFDIYLYPVGMYLLYTKQQHILSSLILHKFLSRKRGDTMVQAYPSDLACQKLPKNN